MEKDCAEPEIDAGKRSNWPLDLAFGRARAGRESENRPKFAVCSTRGGAMLKSDALRAGNVSRLNPYGKCRMSVEIVHDKHNDLGFGVHGQQQMKNEQRPVRPLPLVGYLHGSLAGQRLNRHEQVRRAASFILAVVFGDITGTRWQWVADFRDQLLAALVHAHHWPIGIRRAMVNLQDVFHCRHEFCGRPGRETPAFLQPRLEFVFLRVRRTVS